VIASLVVTLFLVAFLLGHAQGVKKGQVKVVAEPGDCVKLIGQDVEWNSRDDEGEEISSGKVTSKSFDFPDYFQKDVDFGLFWEVWNMIQTEYADRPVSEAQLFYGALEGLVSSLRDPYSVFMVPEDSEEFYDELGGKFEGIGAELSIKNNILTVVSPLKNSPAEKAGLKTNDKILKIDGEITEDMSISKAVDLIRGTKGTEVILSVFREKTSELIDIPIIRNTIKIISSQLYFEEKNGQKIAVIELTNFNTDTDYLLSQNIVEILKENPDGIVLDLRGNPGGYIDQAVNIASHWIQKNKVVVSEKYNDDHQIIHKANGNAELAKFETVVLINSGSASASEILAGALGDYGLAQILGEQSFGKGSVQSVTPFDDGSSLRLTVARWYTPDGHEINGKGITPDIEIELTEEDWNGDKDPQLDRAFEILNK
jgi:carboxyl-terminal processing protease